MIINLRPHRLSYLIDGAVEHLPGGMYKAVQGRWEGDILCSCVPAGRANERVFEDGKVRRYSYVVYLDASEREFTIGEKIRLTLLGSTVELEVAGFARYQTMCKIWA